MPLEPASASFVLPQAPVTLPDTPSAAESSSSSPTSPAVDERPVMTFRRVPDSAVASAWVKHLAAELEACEARWTRPDGTPWRRRARSAGQRKGLVNAAGRFAAELVHAIDAGDRPLIPCPKGNYAFRCGADGACRPLGYKAFLAVYAHWLAMGWIAVVKKGSWRRIDEFGPNAGTGMVERIRVTPAFVAEVRRQGIRQHSAREHFVQASRAGRPPEPLELRTGSCRVGRSKIRGQPLRLEETEVTRRLRAEVEELNAFIRERSVEGPELTGWTRLFHEGDDPGFAWDRGGRLYAAPRNGSYQMLGKTERGQMMIDGESVVEIDISSSHLTIVYGFRGRSLHEEMKVYDDEGRWRHEDPYEIAGHPREVVKLWITASLGSGRPIGRWPSGAAEDLHKRSGERLRLGDHPVKAVGEAVLARHPILGDLSGISWARLQFLESEAIVATMLRLKRDHAIPALPVHDSLIVPRQAWWVAWWVLAEEIEEATGCQPLPFKMAPSWEALPGPHRTRYAAAILRFGD